VSGRGHVAVKVFLEKPLHRSCKGERRRLTGWARARWRIEAWLNLVPEQGKGPGLQGLPQVIGGRWSVYIEPTGPRTVS